MDAEPLVFGTETALGHDYLQAMELAGQYAYAGRDWVCKTVARILGARVLETVHNWHNYAWLENHGGQDLWVVRKGSTPAFPGQRGFVGGTMGDNSVILEGVHAPESVEALHSTVHGAGRAMSRMQARGKVDTRTRKQLTEGAISPHMMSDWLKAKGVTLRGGGLDEAPQAYKRLDEVLAYHAGSVHIVHTLSPIGVAMAGPETYDPFKD